MLLWVWPSGSLIAHMSCLSYFLLSLPINVCEHWCKAITECPHLLLQHSRERDTGSDMEKKNRKLYSDLEIEGEKLADTAISLTHIFQIKCMLTEIANLGQCNLPFHGVNLNVV